MCVELYIYITEYKKWKYTPGVRSKIWSRNSYLQAVCDTPIARITSCVLINYIGRRLPLQLQCSYQGQQDDFSQSVRGKYKTRFWGPTHKTNHSSIYSTDLEQSSLWLVVKSWKNASDLHGRKNSNSIETRNSGNFTHLLISVRKNWQGFFKYYSEHAKLN